MLKIVLPEGTYYGQVETASGILGVFIVSDGKSEKPYRLHFRSPNFNNLWAVTRNLAGLANRRSDSNPIES